MNPEWLKTVREKRKLFFQKNLDKTLIADYEHEMSTPDMVDTADDANLISSWLGDDKHAPALDLDIDHEYVPSSTEGHGHLYLNIELTTEQYKKLLDVLLECGIIEQGFHAQYDKCGATFLRTRKKGELMPSEKAKLAKHSKSHFEDIFDELAPTWVYGITATAAMSTWSKMNWKSKEKKNSEPHGQFPQEF